MKKLDLEIYDRLIIITENRIRHNGYPIEKIKVMIPFKISIQNAIFVIQTISGCRFILKIFDCSIKSQANNELHAIQLLSKQFSFPKIYSYGRFSSTKEFLLLSFSRGRNLQSEILKVPIPEQRLIMEKVGITLANIHLTPVSQIGSLISEDKTQRWDKYLDYQISAWMNEIPFNSPNAKLMKKAIQYVKSHNFPNIEPSFLHGDFILDNIIVTREKNRLHISSIIDFEYALGGHNLYDFRKLCTYTFNVYPHLKESFLKGYRSLIDLSDQFYYYDNLYRIVESIGAISYGIKFVDEFYYNAALRSLEKNLMNI